ncbi:flagellar motor switch protein FliN [Engelhardtia mirabilis]|uniref:Flagellar motor switch protein FliN n=1 Tax=Engelhardtia mirabilis TaxID=2528011 RepID=A0A518BST0_9BACT|nr:Flagellar motor switch protein FliN [Planctomycetes bacterium Pla133]QDV04362.1 Flagellar motor switch protein FliN [Planctomycetes bacterium Pla86]
MSDETTEETTDVEQAIDAATDAVRVQAEGLPELEDSHTESAGMGLPHLLNVPVQVTVEVGRTRLSLAELVKLGPGSLIELDREAHEPADILVNGKVVARGEVVTIDKTYGVRITSVYQN